MDFKAIFTQLQNLITKLNRKQQIVILITVVVIVAFLSYLLVSSLGSKKNDSIDGFGVLFSAENPSDAGSAIAYLKQQNIPYKMLNENTIAVPQEQVFTLRNELSAQGIIKGRVDYDIFNESSFGQTSEELEVKKLRARKGQLEKTLMALAPIQDARVEIAEPKDDVFVTSKAIPRASVTLILKENMGLTPKQIFGIKNLVANSFNGLTPENVFIVDQHGSPLGEQSPEEIENEQAFKNLQFRIKSEQEIADKIRQSLGKLVGGPDRMTVSVNMEYDFGKQESTEEEYSKESAVVSETGEEISISEYEATEVVSSRLEEILKLAKKQINLLTKKEIHYIMITGGVSEMANFSILLEEVFGHNAKIGQTNEIGVRSNIYSACVGFIKYYEEKLKLRNQEFSIFSESEIEELSSVPKKLSFGENSVLGKLFGYFFDN